MVPKITVGAGLRGALEYDQSSKDGALRAEWVAGTLVGTPREMAAQAGHFRALRPDCKKPVWRCSISLPPPDGRQTLQKWESIATDFLREMGIPKTAAWCAIRHFERDHDHIHLTVLRTLPDGSLWNQEHSARRAIKACEKLEQVHNLSTHSRTPAPKDRPSRAEIEISNRKGIPMSREIIQDSVNSILQAHPQGIDFVELQKLLAIKGVDVQPYAPGGVLKGVSYLYDSFKWPGSKIGREFSAGLPERGVRFRVDTEKASKHKSQEAHGQTPTAVRSVVPDLRPQFDPKNPQGRMPAMLRPILQQPLPMHGKPAVPVGHSFDMQKFTGQIQSLNIGPVSKALLVLGGAAINLTLAALNALMRFLAKILSTFGIGLRPAPDNATGQVVPGLGHEPYFIDATAKVLPQPEAGQPSIEQAAKEVLKTAEAIATGDPSLLPGEGAERDALIRALTEQTGSASGAVAQGAAPVATASSLDEIFGTSGIPAMVQPSMPQPPKATVDTPTDPISRLKESSDVYVDLREQVWVSYSQPTGPATRARLAPSMQPALAQYERDLDALRAICTHELTRVADETLRKKLSLDLNSALGLLRSIGTPGSLGQNLRSLVNSGMNRIIDARSAIAADLARSRHRLEMIDHDPVHSQHDTPRG